MPWTTLWFGKHKGKTLPQVLFSDPDWFFLAVEKGVFKGKGKLEDEAEELDEKARSIRIPQSDDQDLVAEYFIHRPTGKFARLILVPRDRPLHEGSSRAERKDVIDLSFPRTLARYDKLGCGNLLRDVKLYLFGRSRVNKRRCEEFFEDASNFVT